MSAPLRLRPAFLLFLLPLALLLWLGWRAWQGPLLPGYRLEMRPLVQRVVASGEVSSQSLARVGSELTGVVKARHVREGDSVEPGQLLLELDDTEQQARRIPSPLISRLHVATTAQFPMYAARSEEHTSELQSHW